MNIKENKQVSILMAVLNGEPYIKQTIESIIKQIHRNWELIVINNGSTDNTVSIVKAFALEDERVKLLNMPKPGKIEAYNRGFESSTGDLIAFIGADDILPEDSVSLRIESLKNDNYFSTCLLQTFSALPKHDGLIFPKNKMLPNYSGGSILFSKKIGSMIFPIPLELPNEDTWSSLYLRAFAVNKHIPSPLYLYRIHSNNTYGYGSSFEKKRQGFFKRMKAYKLFYAKHKHENNPFIKNYVFNYIQATEYSQEKKVLPLLFLPSLSMVEKLKFIMFANKFLFWFRNYFFKLFSGVSN